MLLNLQKNNRLKYYFNFLIALFPLSYIAGNLVINLNIVLIIFSTLIIYNKQIFEIKFELLDKVIFAYFLFILFTGIYNEIYFQINDLHPEDYNTLIKSLLFFRYFFLYMAIRFLIEKDILNLKLFFILCAFSSIFVSLDIFYQFIFGVDIFGYKPIETSRKLSGPFGDELIAGSFIQRFSIFAFFLIPFFFKEKIQLSKIFNIIFFLIFLLAIILSGNRMPFVIFILSIVLIFLFEKKIRKYFFIFFIFFLLSFIAVLKLNKQVNNNFTNFYVQIKNIVTIVYNDEAYVSKSSSYFREFATFYDTWLMNKYIGGGIKNFRYYCHYRKPGIAGSEGFICNMHPHNYYLEVLCDTGLFGFIILFTILSLTIHKIFKKDLNRKFVFSDNRILIPIMVLFIAEIFPLKSTGSFYTTTNATYFFLLLGLIISGLNKKKIIEN